jgi:hypothetical protein
MNVTDAEKTGVGQFTVKLDRAERELGPEIAGDIGGRLHLLHHAQRVTGGAQAHRNPTVQFVNTESFASAEHHVPRCHAAPCCVAGCSVPNSPLSWPR